MSTVRSFTSSRLSPFDRGVEFGSAHAREVGVTLEFYRELLARCPVPGVTLEGWGPAAKQAIESAAPALAEELKGLAAGAHVPPAELAAVNARTELLAMADPDGVVECSAVVRSRDGVNFGAQTWDWYGGMSDNWLAWTVPHEGGWFTTVTEFGILGKLGVNSNGVGLLFNILGHDNDGGNRVGFPVHLAARRALEHATTAQHAAQLLAEFHVSASSAMTVFDRGHAVSVELFPGGPALHESASDVLVHTNHFVTVAGAPGCRFEGVNSQRRHDVLSARAAEPDISLREALISHDIEGPSCVHGETAESEATLATVEIDVAEPALRAWRGGPCGTFSDSGSAAQQ